MLVVRMGAAASMGASVGVASGTAASGVAALLALLGASNDAASGSEASGTTTIAVNGAPASGVEPGASSSPMFIATMMATMIAAVLAIAAAVIRRLRPATGSPVLASALCSTSAPPWSSMGVGTASPS